MMIVKTVKPYVNPTAQKAAIECARDCKHQPGRHSSGESIRIEKNWNGKSLKDYTE
jgi:hypothetical protein